MSGNEPIDSLTLIAIGENLENASQSCAESSNAQTCYIGDIEKEESSSISFDGTISEVFALFTVESTGYLKRKRC